MDSNLGPLEYEAIALTTLPPPLPTTQNLYLLRSVSSAGIEEVILDAAEPLDGQPPPALVPDGPTRLLGQLLHAEELGRAAEDERPHGLVPVERDPGVRPGRGQLRQVLLLLLQLLLLLR